MTPKKRMIDLADTSNKVDIKFGTDGWRGIVAEDFTFENVRAVAGAIGNYLVKSGADTVVIGYDARFLGPEFAALCADVLGAQGLAAHVFERPMPTPVTAFTIKEIGAGGGIMLTASHNPPDYQGIKFIADFAGPAPTEVTSAIEKEIGAPPAFAKTTGAPVTKIINIEAYWEQLSRLIDFELIKSASLKVVLDPMHGAAAGLFSARARELFAGVMAIHDEFDPLFGGRSPDPNSHNLEDLAADVLAGGNDIGLATDGDADRFGIVDSLGVYLSPNQVISLLADYLLEHRGLKGAVVRTVATTHLLDAIAVDFGADLIETPVGFKWICQEMLRRPVVIGGEESGGLSILGHIPEKDGILACLLAAEMVAATGKKPLSVTLAELHDRYGHRYGIRMDVHLTLERKEKLMSEMAGAPPTDIAGIEVEKVITVDGVKFILAGGDWLLIRPSGTEPLVRVYIESTSADRFTRLESFAQSLAK